MLVIGLDGYPRGWVVAAIEDGDLLDLTTAADAGAALAMFPGATAVGIDIPIGLPSGPDPRPADLETRALLGARSGTIFLTPPYDVIAAESHAEAVQRARAIGCPAPSAQAYSLRRKILEVAPLAEADPRLFEVHPELAFRMLKSEPLTTRKRTWAGIAERLDLLDQAGLHPAPAFPAARVAAPDDILDATVTALTAWRYATGTATAIPASETTHPHHRIWHPGA